MLIIKKQRLVALPPITQAGYTRVTALQDIGSDLENCSENPLTMSERFCIIVPVNKITTK